jgi:chromosome segregation ATPase
MAEQSQQPQESDLDRTDLLPILEGVILDPDVADDAVRMDFVAPPPRAPLAAGATDFIRPSAVDLPSLAESMRSVEERIATQSAEYEALSRSYERARAAESASAARAVALQREVEAVRTALASEQQRSEQVEKMLAETLSSIEGSRSRAEDALRESERHQAEARTLRDSLASRDATIVQVLHSLGERDAQLAALQSEHAKVLPDLDARTKAGAQLERELAAARKQLGAATEELQARQAAAAALKEELARNETAANAARADLTATKRQASSYLELLRTRDWRRGFEENLLRELDARAGAADHGLAALKAERDGLQSQMAALAAKLAAQNATIDSMRINAELQASIHAQQANDLQQRERDHAEWAAKLAFAESEQKRLNADLAARDLALAEARQTMKTDAQRIAQLQSEHAAEIAQLRADAETHDEEMTVLMAHLQEARRPIESIADDAKRLKEQLAAKTAAIEAITEEADKLRTALERTRGALEEREFLIRRLERSESNNANVLGRIQTSMERLGSVAASAANPSAGLEWVPELIRIDGDNSVSHALGRRTRIGRAPGCELHVDSSSVSRHHALILLGMREAIIEDLNSTNGVILNGRKVTRQVLNDGDILTIGEIQFRYVARPAGAAAAKPSS